MPKYTGINGEVREITSQYTGINGEVREIKEEYCGVNGEVRKIFGNSSLVLYKNGTFASEMGGITPVHKNNSSYNSYTYKNNETYFSCGDISTNGYSDYWYRSTKLIDFSKYSTLKMTFSLTNVSISNSTYPNRFSVRVGTNAGNIAGLSSYLTIIYDKQGVTTNIAKQTVEIDVSNISGEQYLYIAPTSGSYAQDTLQANIYHLELY